MPFDLKSAPITFQRMINILLCDVLGISNDLFICSKNGDNHLVNLEAVLFNLNEAYMKAKLTICELLKAKITFLCHTVDVNGIHTMGDKISVIKNFPQPQIVENVRSFIGLCDIIDLSLMGFPKSHLF